MNRTYRFCGIEAEPHVWILLVIGLAFALGICGTAIDRACADLVSNPSGAEIGDLVIYGDSFQTTGSFLAIARLARDAWLEYGEAYAHGRASFGSDYSWNFQRSGSYLLRNAQRTIIPCKQHARFVNCLAKQTFNLRQYRVIVLSRGTFKSCTVDGVGFYSVPDIVNKHKLMDDLELWYRTGYMEDEL